MNAPHITVAILTHNQASLTLACLRSYEQLGWPSRVVLLDNGGGSDASRVKVAFSQRMPDDLTVLIADSNLGVARGRNYLASIVMTEWIAFLDNDTLFTPELLPFFNDLRVTNADLVFPIVLWPDGRVNSAGGRFRPFLSWSSNGYYGSRLADARESLERATDWGLGAAFIVRRECFSNLGGFDAEHGLYGAEDLDFSLRAKRTGLQSIRVAHAPVIHLDARSSIPEAERLSSLAKSARLIRSRHGLAVTRPLSAAWYAFRRSTLLAPLKDLLVLSFRAARFRDLSGRRAPDLIPSSSPGRQSRIANTREKP